MASIKTNLQEDFKKRICQFRKMYSDKGESFTVKHFMEEGVDHIIQRVDNNVDSLRSKGSGGKAKKKRK